MGPFIENTHTGKRKNCEKHGDLRDPGFFKKLHLCLENKSKAKVEILLEALPDAVRCHHWRRLEHLERCTAFEYGPSADDTGEHVFQPLPCALSEHPWASVTGLRTAERRIGLSGILSFYFTLFFLYIEA